MRVLILILMAALTVPGLAGDRLSRAWAAEEAPPRAPGGTLGEAGSAYCDAVARHCGLACQAGTEPGSAASAACEARCAVERAACDTRDALSRLQPWLDDKTRMVDRFMDGFEADPEDGGRGDPGAGPPTQETCRTSHEHCMNRCEGRFEDAYTRAGCESICTLDRATCETAAGIETARPLIEREARRLQDFLDALRGREDAPPPPRPLDEVDPDGDDVLDI